VPILHGLWVWYLVRAQLTTAHNALGGALYFLGELPLARAHVAQALALYTPPQPRTDALLRWRADAEVVGRCHTTHILWLLGYPDQALQQSQEALALAQALEHPWSLAFACLPAARLHQFRREVHGVYKHAEAVIALATAHGFPHYVALGTILRGWALTAQAQEAAGMTQYGRASRAIGQLGHTSISRMCWRCSRRRLAGVAGSTRGSPTSPRR